MASSGGSEKPSSPPAAHRSGARLALISVSDKTGVTDFARGIAAHGYELLSTGGTARLLREAGLEVTEVSDYTGSPEIMDGRVKTLHPRIHGGLLGREGIDDELMAQQLIRRIHLLVLNLYPFEEVTSRPGCSLDEAVEHIDIGGPALLRSAAKNFRSVAVVSAPEQYADVLQGLDAGNGTLDEATRYRLAVRAFQHVARYDEAIGSFLSGRDAEGRAQPFPPALRLRFTKLQDLRYGENPHQQAAWYRDPRPAAGSLAMLRQIQGKELSFNNIADADAAWACVGQFDAPACVIVKHANPCGAAVAGSALQAYERAYATDATSAFGGVIALNRKIDGDCAKAIIERQFVELLIAPGYSKDALKALSGKPGVRVLQIPPGPSGEGMDFRRVGGGLLVQTRDGDAIGRADCRVASARRPGDEQWEDLLFAWKIARMVKSNAIVYARDGRTLGIGAGQMSRIDSVRIATWKAGDAGLSLGGAAMASDAFFPFRDGIDAAAGAGIASVIQPGGSKRDEEVIAAADEHGMALVFTGIRHFRH